MAIFSDDVRGDETCPGEEGGKGGWRVEYSVMSCALLILVITMLDL